jgi:hypothetical protein
MSTILKNKILDQLRSTSFSTSDNQLNIDRSIKSITQGIYNYITSDFSTTAFTAGSYFTTVPIPHSESLNAQKITTTHNQSNLQTLWKNNVANGTPNLSISRMFRAISLWLTSPPFQITLQPPTPVVILQSIIPQHPIPIMPILYPTMALQGIACENEILATTFPKQPPESVNKFWEIVARHIHLSLTSNVIAPIPTAGLATPSLFPYTGLTTVILTYN